MAHTDWQAFARKLLEATTDPAAMDRMRAEIEAELDCQCGDMACTHPAHRKDNECESCGDSPEWRRGILLGANGDETVEACDCERYESDLDAAYMIATAVGGVVVWEQWDQVAKRYTGRRTYDGTGSHDDCLGYGEYPWVEIGGDSINWFHFHVITAAFDKREDRQS